MLQVKDRHLNPKAACLKKREEEKAALRIGSCSTPNNPLTPTGDATFDFEGLSGGDALTLPVPPTTTNGSMPSTSSSNNSRSISPTAYYSTSAGSPFQSTSPSFTYSIPYNPSPPPLTPTDKIPRVKSEGGNMKRKANGNVSPTLRKAKGGGRVLSPVVGGNANLPRTDSR